MHRVELKAPTEGGITGLNFSVPNAPCGVERKVRGGYRVSLQCVPNAPCGVESEHRETNEYAVAKHVPNAPCGVESFLFLHFHLQPRLFLMHRVELKDEGVILS